MSGSAETPPQNSPEPATDKDLPRRLRVIIGAESMASFARRVGVSRQWLYRILNGEPASVAVLSSIVDSTGYSLDWLARGEGMPIGASAGRFEMISRLTARIDAHNEVTFGQADAPPVIVPAELFTELNIDAAKVGVLAAPDDGMSPTIWAMDDLLIDPSDRQPAEGEIFLVSKAGRLTIGRVFQVEGTWIFASEGPGNTPFGLFGGATSENLTIAGRVHLIMNRKLTKRKR